MGHARFHLVWQVLNVALAGLVEIFYVAACLVAIMLVAFWGALAGMRLYGGALFDPNGILPTKVRMGGRILYLDMNTVAVTLGSLVLLISVGIYA